MHWGSGGDQCPSGPQDTVSRPDSRYPWRQLNVTVAPGLKGGIRCPDMDAPGTLGNGHTASAREKDIHAVDELVILATNITLCLVVKHFSFRKSQSAVQAISKAKTIKH